MITKLSTFVKEHSDNIKSPEVTVTYKELYDSILKCFVDTTKYTSKISPNIRYAFSVDTPSASSIYFRTTYYGDWFDNIQVSVRSDEDYFRISQDKQTIKSTDLNMLRKRLEELHSKKVTTYKSYLSNEYTDELGLLNMTNTVFNH